MTSQRDLHPLSEVFKALGSEVRLKILMMVSETKRPLHIKAISRQLNLDYAAIYRHVKVLKDARLINVYEVGRSRVIEVVREELIEKILKDGEALISDT